MDNQKKLELTLCGMLPYKLKAEVKNYGIEQKTFTVTCLGIINDEVIVESPYGGHDYTDFEDFKPLLHSLDKLLTGILDEENSYYFNLNCELCDILEVSDCEYFLKSLIYNQYYAVSLNKAFEALEWLKKNHFNIYNLPEEMYIKKSESNGK